MGLANRSGPDMSARLLMALTALYTERPVHTTEERQQYVALALRLIDNVDEPTRKTVARILHGHPGAPVEVRERLAMPKLPAAQPGAANLSGDRSMKLDAGEGIATAAASDLSAPASAASNPAPTDLGETFFAADAAERRRLLSAVAATNEGSRAEPLALPHLAVDRYRGLDQAAMEGRIGEFVREFARTLGIPKTLSERILNDQSGEPMVVAARALNMPIAVLQRILLLVNPAVSHSVQRVYDLTDLFHDLDRTTAARLMSWWRAQALATERDAPPAPTALPVQRGLPALRARFGTLAARLGTSEVSARSDPGSAGRSDLRSR